MDDKFIVYEKGLIIGSFYPLHVGHLKLLEFARSKCKNLHIAIRDPDVSSPKYEPKKLMADYFSSYKSLFFVNISEIDEWFDVDVIFGNNERSKELANKLKAKALLSSEPMVGTSKKEILENPLKHWDLLADLVKPYFCKSILFIGPESTGKSVLAKSLAQALDGQYVEEFGRTYDQQFKSHLYKEVENPNSVWSLEDFIKIAVGQDELIEKAKFCGKKLLFIDTEAITTEIFAWLYLRETSSILKEYIKKQEFDLIFFLDHEDTLFEKDEIRRLEDIRKFNSDFIKNSFDFYNKKYIVCYNKDGYKAREEKVKNTITEKLGL